MARLTQPRPPELQGAYWMPEHGWFTPWSPPTALERALRLSEPVPLVPRCPAGHLLDGEAPLAEDGSCRACRNEAILRGAA